MNSFVVFRDRSRDYGDYGRGRGQTPQDGCGAVASSIVGGSVVLVETERSPRAACTEVAELMVASDVGVLASHEEAFSYAVLENVAAGSLMVATRVGGDPDAVLDGETGILVPRDSPAALGRTIVRLATD